MSQFKHVKASQSQEVETRRSEADHSWPLGSRISKEELEQKIERRLKIKLWVSVRNFLSFLLGETRKFTAFDRSLHGHFVTVWRVFQK